MQEFDLSLEILNQILDEKIAFNDALKNKFQTEIALRPLRPLVAGLVGCELRHHLLFLFLVSGIEKELPEGTEPLNEAQKRFLALVLGNDFFFRRLPADKANEAFKDFLGDDEKYARYAPLFEKAGSVNDLIPESISRSSDEYLSLRYNTPSWALKIWKHFHYGNLYKTLRSFARPESFFLRIRTSLISEEEVLANPDFKPTSVSGVVSYVGKTPLRKLDWVKEGKIFLERPLTKSLFDAHKVSEPGEILLYNGNADSSLEKELIESYGSSVGINLGTPDVDQKIAITKTIKDLGLHNVNFFSVSDPLCMEAAVSKKQDVVICAPDSTNFDLVRSTPDYLLRFDKDKMDGLLEGEKNALEGCAKFVEDNGVLIYVVYTLSKKEGHATVASFLQAHSDFKLESETQHFPFEDLATAAYVALLRKSPAEETAEIPSADPSLLKPAETVSASLSSDAEGSR